MKRFHVVVIGGGSAGTAAARAAAENGARTVMFNDGELGGLCILRGCMPTKTMLHAAHLVHEAAHHRTPAIGHAELSVDFAALMANKDAKVARFKKAKTDSIAAADYTVVDARARFISDHEVEAGGERYQFTSGAVIATGSTPNRPSIDGIDRVEYLTSDDVMQLSRAPESLAVIGSGAIGLELAQFFSRVGTWVHLVSRRPVFCDIDPLIGDEMRAILSAEPRFDLWAPAPPIEIAPRHSGGVVLTIKAPGGDRELHVDALLVATGRSANVANLNLEAAGVELRDGVISAGPDMATSNPRIFVAGDASGSRQLLHVANWEGAVAGRGAAQAPGRHHVEQRLHMEVMFTDPPLATIGLNQQQACATGHDVITATARFAETGRAITQDVHHGAWKIVADRSGEILGSQILGPRADDLVHILSTAMYYHGTVDQLLEMPWYHPTVSEVLLGLVRDLRDQMSSHGG